MNIDFGSPITKKIIELDRISVLRLQAEHSGIAYFPDRDEAVVDSVLTQRLWSERGVQQHWMPEFGLGVGAYVNSCSAELQIMSMKEASCNTFENAFEEALADPEWVTMHARDRA